MNAFVLVPLICAFQYPSVWADDSAETTTATGDTTVSSGPVDFDAFDADLNDVYKSIAKIKSKASKLELIGPKIQSAMLHLAGDEEDVAKNLKAKYEQILPLLQQLKIDDTITQKSAAAAARRKRDVTSGATESTIADMGNTKLSTDSVYSNTANTETINTDFTTESITAEITMADALLSDANSTYASASLTNSSTPSA